MGGEATGGGDGGGVAGIMKAPATKEWGKGEVEMKDQGQEQRETKARENSNQIQTGKSDSVVAAAVDNGATLPIKEGEVT